MDIKIFSESKKMRVISGSILAVFALSLFVSPVSAIVVQPESSAIPSVSPAASTAPVSEKPGTATLQNYLAALRKERQDFKEFTDKEAGEKALALKEKVASKKKAIEARIAEAKKSKEEKRKTVLIKLIDVQVKQFENTKERVDKMTNIPDISKKAELKAAIDKAILDLKTEKEKVVAATTPEELKNIAKEIKDLFKAKRDIVKKIVDAILVSRVNKNVTTAKNQLATLKSKINELKAAGTNTAQLELLLSTAEQKIGAIKTTSSREEIKDAIDELKEAYKNMKDAASLLIPANATGE